MRSAAHMFDTHTTRINADMCPTTNALGTANSGFQLFVFISRVHCSRQTRYLKYVGLISLTQVYSSRKIKLCGSLMAVSMSQPIQQIRVTFFLYICDISTLSSCLATMTWRISGCGWKVIANVMNERLRAVDSR